MRKSAWILPLFIGLTLPALAQGTREDYTRADHFLAWNVRKMFLDADVTPHWVGKSSKFWYRKPELGSDNKSFMLVGCCARHGCPRFRS